MEIKFCQISSALGDIKQNAQTLIRLSKENHADLLVFPELFLTGYHPRDLLVKPQFLQDVQNQLLLIEKEIKTPVLFGCPILEGRTIYNGAIYFAKQEKKIFKKLKLPFYNVFDENRYFSVPEEVSADEVLLEINGFRFIVSLCEDIWPSETVFPTHFQYDPKSLWKEIKTPDAILNLSASPYFKHRSNERKNLLLNVAKDFSCPVFYLNTFGLNEEILYDGQSLIVGQSSLEYEARAFEEEFFSINLRKDKTFEVNLPKKRGEEDKKNEEEILLEALIFGIKTFFQQNGFKKAVVGLSGGIDSSLVTCLAVMALGKENVHPILLPGPYSSPGSISHSLELCKNLGLKAREVSIKESFEFLRHHLKQNEVKTLKTLTEENLQARLRGLMLMAISSEEEALVLNCSNKSEIAVGYSTLYGDTIGSCCPIGDLYKTEVYALARLINQKKELVPQAILDKEPSAELSPKQKDSDSLPPYSVLDAILFQALEEGKTKEEISKHLKLEVSFVENVFRKIKYSEFKRFQAPPIFRISPLAFGFGRRISLSTGYDDLV